MSKARPIPAAVPGAPLRVNTSLPLMVRLEELVAYDRTVHDPANVEEIHEMRIAVKRLRYTLEIFTSVIEDADGFLKTLKSFQDLLGAIHDADVLAPLLEAGMTDKHAADEMGPVIRALHEHARTERTRLYDEFIRAWNAALDAGFSIRLWDTALAASAPSPGPKAKASDVHRLLPPKRMRRVQKAVALLRLAPYATAAAPPERAGRLARALEQVHDTMLGRDVEDVDDREWWKAVKRLGKLISYEEA